MDKKWSKRLQEILKASGMSKPKLAEEIGVHRNQLYDWLRCKYRPNVDNGEKIMDIYRKEVGE